MDGEAQIDGGFVLSRHGERGPWSSQIDALFADHDRSGSPGLNLGVVKDGVVVHARGYGVASLEDDIPFRPDTRLHLGSTTKHLCAACILILEDRGLLSLA